MDKDGGYATFPGRYCHLRQPAITRTTATLGTYARLTVAYAPQFLSKHPLWRVGSKRQQVFPHFPAQHAGPERLRAVVAGKTLPFYLLPEMGNDNIMRGYYTGRYRDQNYLAAQAEIPLLLRSEDAYQYVVHRHAAHLCPGGLRRHRHRICQPRFCAGQAEAQLRPGCPLFLRQTYPPHYKAGLRLG